MNRPRTALRTVAAILWVLAAWQLPLAGQAPPAVSSADDARAILDRYCVGCHSDRLRTAGLTLQAVDLASPAAHAETLEKAIVKLRLGSMPPAGRPRPAPAVYGALAGWLETELDREAAAHPNPGRTESLHRLNRTEYANVIRDLLDLEGLNFATLLPSDDRSYGFDNVAGALGMTPTHLERYLDAARQISRIAVGDTSLPPGGETFILPPDLSQDDRFEQLPFGTRGGTLVRSYFPADGDYIIRFQAFTGVGLSEEEPNFIELSVDGERVFFEEMAQTPIRRTISGADIQSNTDWEVRVPIEAGLRDVAVTFVKTTSGQLEDLLQPFLRPSRHLLVPPDADGRLFRSVHRSTVVYRTVRRHRSGRYAEPPPHLHLPPVWSGGSRRGAVRAKHPVVAGPSRVSAAGDGRRRRTHSSSSIGRDAETEISSAGSRWRWSGCWRAPISSSASSGIRGTARRGAVHAISDLELASRLSFFLWSSIPDDELLEVASRGELRDEAVLVEQTRRMLADPRSASLITNFAGQWLRLRNLPGIDRDAHLFPDFDDNLRRAMRRETELLLETIAREDRSMLELLAADYTFVNERLARHYGIPNIAGSHFRRVPVTDPNRRGILGHASILTVTSQSNRTSPVTRGKWILENLLGAPPPAPPDEVPGLEETRLEGTLRERMVQHRRNPVCASCHQAMDPLGFSLENFSPLGEWRTVDAGFPVDAGGAMPDGITTFEGVSGLRRALLDKSDVFISTLTEKLLIYALGRGIEYYDKPAVRDIRRQAARHDYRFSALIEGIVTSAPFRMRTAD